MDGPLRLSGPLRPVPVYSRRPLELEPSLENLFTIPRIHSSPGSSEKVKDKARPLPPHQLPLPSPLPPPPLPPRPDLDGKGFVVPPFGKTRELSPMNKNGVPLITPVRGPDPRSVALYQSLLRHHPAYHHLLETFLVPPLPPLLCHPAAALCDAPVTFCSPPFSAPVSAAAAAMEEERRRAQSMPLPSKEPAARGQSQQSAAHSSTAEDGKSQKLSAEELVSSITAVPDPFQQYGYGRKLFPCPQCRYTTDRRNNLKRHMLTMHQLSAKLLECCGVLFRTKAALREHALIFHYHGYTCFYCGRRFCRKALLKRHLSVHNGQKEFICNVCDYATSHKSNLERHRRVHVRQDGDPDPEGDLGHHEGPEPLSDDVKSNVSETNSNVDVSCDELSVCSDDEDEEINVHSD